MRRTFLLMVVVGVSLASFAAQVSMTRSKNSDSFEAIVQIYSYFEDESGDYYEGTGSGSIISSDGLILTNSHLVRDDYTGAEPDAISICFFQSAFEMPTCREMGEVVASSEFYDLALVRPMERYNLFLEDFEPIPEDDTRVYPTVDFLTSSTDEEDLPEIRDVISIIGYPDATGTYQITATTGTITGYDSDQLDYIDLVTDAIINAGNSGGAAFDDQDRFIGVPYANSLEGYGGQYGYIVPVTEVNLWFESLVEEEIIAEHPAMFRQELRGAADDESPEAVAERVQVLEDKVSVLESGHNSLQQRMAWVVVGVMVLFGLLMWELYRIHHFHHREEEFRQ